MSTIFFILAFISMGAVLVSLAVGVTAMARGGDKNRQTSQKMMQMRVYTQGAAVIFLMLALLTR